jgi:hypothetical protein
VYYITYYAYEQNSSFNIGGFTKDPSAAPPTVFRLAEVNSGWRAAINSAGGGAEIFRRRAAANSA